MNLATIISRVAPLKSPKTFEDFDEVLKQYLKYVRLYKDYQEQIEVLDNFKSVFHIPTFIGLEIEVENIHKNLALPDFWKCKIDGSLREGGMEFVSSPLTPEQAMKASIALWMLMRKLIPSHSPEFSWRTSSHVHLNALDLNEEEFKRLILLSLLFEPLFFSFVGKEREDGVFCVPATQCTAWKKLADYFQKKRSFLELCTEWPKYTAVNLCRMYPYPYTPGNLTHPGVVPALGTIEFRHLGGTDSPLPLLTWIAMILQLFEAAIKVTDLEKRMLSLTPQEYMKFALEIFSPQIVREFKAPDEGSLFFVLTRAKELLLPAPKLGALKATSALSLYANKVARQLERDKLTAIKAKKVKLSASLDQFAASLSSNPITF